MRIASIVYIPRLKMKCVEPYINITIDRTSGIHPTVNIKWCSFEIIVIQRFFVKRYRADIPLLQSLDIQYQCGFHCTLVDSQHQAHLGLSGELRQI